MTDREKWCAAMCKIAYPILRDMSCGQLKKSMSIEYSARWDGRDKGVAYMEAFGRLMSGIAPWLAAPNNDPSEKQWHDKLYVWALQSYTHAVNPQSPDYLLWSREWQPLVDAAYIAHSFLRGYEQLWLALSEETRKRYIQEFKALRRVTPPYNNWILYPAIIEMFLKIACGECDFYRIEYAIKKVEEWYVGDGWYSDGPSFAFDYYNSFVIHPMYLECLETLVELGYPYEQIYNRALRRMQRYACILERMISPEGYFPPIGRSITYRTAVFQPLSMLALNEQLPQSLSNGQVRSALTQVIENMYLSDNKNFDKEGYLTLGFNGHQPGIADYYTNTGSLYIASLIFLPMGLSITHPFWQTPTVPWTMKKAWQGNEFLIDGE